MKAFLRQMLDPALPAARRWALAGGLALALTVGVRLIDDRLAERNNKNYGSIVARQLASQAEGLALAAGQKNLSDPLGWTIFHLSQGVEPRFFQFAKERVTVEEWNLSRSGEIEVRKPLTIPGKDDGLGIRIIVQLPRTGFLGTTSSGARDFASVLIFGFLTLFFGFLLQLRSERFFKNAALSRQAQVRTQLPAMKEAMLGFGQQLREIFRKFETLGNTSREASTNIEHARDTFHKSIQATRQSLKTADELAGLCISAEVSSLNVLLEKSGGGSAIYTRLLQQQISEVRNRCTRLQAELRALERTLEPVTTDLDVSFHAISDAQDVLRLIPDEIHVSSTRIHQQAQAFQELKAASMK